MSPSAAPYHGRPYLTSAKGAVDHATYLSAPTHHALWHCLAVWACTAKGSKFLGADKAAQRALKDLRDKPNEGG